MVKIQEYVGEITLEEVQALLAKRLDFLIKYLQEHKESFERDGVFDANNLVLAWHMTMLFRCQDLCELIAAGQEPAKE